MYNVSHNPEAIAAMTAPTCTRISNCFTVTKNTGKSLHVCTYACTHITSLHTWNPKC